MIFNFEYEHDGVLYDADAESRLVGHDGLEIALLEVRRVNCTGEGFVALALDGLGQDLLSALQAAAAAEYELLCEPDAPRVFDRD